MGGEVDFIRGLPSDELIDWLSRGMQGKLGGELYGRGELGVAALEELVARGEEIPSGMIGSLIVGWAQDDRALELAFGQRANDLEIIQCMAGHWVVFLSGGGEYRVLDDLSDEEWYTLCRALSRRRVSRDGVFAFSILVQMSSGKRLGRLLDTVNGALREALCKAVLAETPSERPGVSQRVVCFEYFRERILDAGGDVDVAWGLLLEHPEISLDELVACMGGLG